MKQSTAQHEISPIAWVRGTYYMTIDGKTHSAGRRRTLRRLSQCKTGMTPSVFRPVTNGR